MLEKEVATTLRKTNKLIVNLFRAQIEEYDLSFRLFHILLLIKEKPEITQKELANTLRLTQGAISTSIKTLLEKNYLKQVPLEKDNRFNRLVLTDEVNDIIVDNENTLNDKYVQMFNGFTRDEIKHFESYLFRLNDNLEDFKMNKKEGRNS